jgi:hypothetical protein
MLTAPRASLEPGFAFVAAILVSKMLFEDTRFGAGAGDLRR